MSDKSKSFSQLFLRFIENREILLISDPSKSYPTTSYPFIMWRQMRPTQTLMDALRSATTRSNKAGQGGILRRWRQHSI